VSSEFDLVELIVDHPQVQKLDKCLNGKSSLAIILSDVQRQATFLAPGFKKERGGLLDSMSTGEAGIGLKLNGPGVLKDRQMQRKESPD